MKIFYSKMDSFFLKLIALIILLLGTFTFFPLMIEKNPDVSLIITLVVVYFVMLLFILWTVLTIEYRFQDDYLMVKGGPFKSRIAYDDISKVSPTTEVMGGYTVLSARHSLEIFYSKSMLGSVKISPYDQKEFLIELKKRCPHLQTM